MWYDEYCGFPYKHLGEDPETGIDCFNLVRHIYMKERDIIIPYTTSDFCDNSDEQWYSQTSIQSIKQAAVPEFGWMEVGDPHIFDVIIMSIGSTNIVNHCSMYVGNNLMIQTMLNHKSWIAPYGKWYKQYTDKIVRWMGM